MHSTSLPQSLQDLSIMLRIPNSMVFKSVQYLALGLFCEFSHPPLPTTQHLAFFLFLQQVTCHFLHVVYSSLFCLMVVPLCHLGLR